MMQINFFVSEVHLNRTSIFNSYLTKNDRQSHQNIGLVRSCTETAAYSDSLKKSRKNCALNHELLSIISDGKSNKW